VQLAHKMLSTRGGTIAISAVAGLVAAAIILMYLHRYRESVGTAAQPMTVLVAKDLIEKGTPGDIVGSDALFQAVTTPRSEVKEGAITDPAALRGTVAVDDVYPGEQLTAEAFSGAGADTIATRISADERAIAVPIDNAHGMVGSVASGDHVDVYAGFNVRKLLPNGAPDPNAQDRPVLKLIVEDVVVLDAPEAGGAAVGGAQSQAVTLRMTESDAANVAFSSDNGIVWIVMRPPAGAEPTQPDIITLETVLFGIPPVAAAKSLGAKP
jgi:Flp pilus assembly protein CpaB